MRTFNAVLLAASLLATEGKLVSADWGEWRGPGRTGHVPLGEAIPTNLPTEASFAWHLKIGDGFSSPVVAGGRVFYMDNQDGYEALHAVEAATGHELWRTNIDKTFKDTQTVPGPRCTPVADGDRIYAQSCRGELHCRKAADGSLLWKTSFSGDFGAVFIGETGSAQGAMRHGNDGSPLVDGQTLYVQVGSTNGAGLVAFDKLTGKVLWKSQNDVAGYASPFLASLAGTRQLLSFTADGLLSVAPSDGRFLWRVPMKTSFSRHVMTPIVRDDYVVISSHEVGLEGIKVATANGEWTAEKAWLKKETAINFACPVEEAGYIYGVGPTKDLVCVELKTGQRQWAQTGYVAGSAANAYAGFIVMGKNILALTDGGQIVLFAADPQAFHELGTLQVCGKNWCNPAYANGHLYFRDAHELFSLKLIP